MSATGVFQNELEVGMSLDALDQLMQSPHIADPAAVVGLLRRDLSPGVVDDLMHEGGTSALHTVRQGMLRAIRTTAPIVIADVVGLALAGIIAESLTRWLVGVQGPLHGWGAPIVMLPLLAAYWLTQLYSEIWIHPVMELRQITQITTLAMLAAGIGAMVSWPLGIWCFFAWAAVVSLVPMLRTVARAVCSQRRWWGYPTLVVGVGHGATTLAQTLLDCPRSGLRPSLINDPQGILRASIMPVVNDPATLRSMVRAEGIRHAVISLPELRSGEASELLDSFSELVPHLLVLSDASTLPTFWGAARNTGRLSGIEMRNGLMMATLQIVKRFIDLTVALVALTMTLPIFCIIPILIKLGGGGPAFFGHKRIGRHGRMFTAWKFRTMHVDGDKILRDYLERVAGARDEWDRDQKLRDDPRVTRVGKLLRMTSLDELPQIWNVLRGDMSIVGPRPIVTSEIVRYGSAFPRYTTVKPGITGLWQVSGRNDVSYDDRVRLDEFYTRHWSPWLDIYILAKTFVALIKRQGAY